MNEFQFMKTMEVLNPLSNEKNLSTAALQVIEQVKEKELISWQHDYLVDFLVLIIRDSGSLAGAAQASSSKNERFLGIFRQYFPEITAEGLKKMTSMLSGWELGRTDSKEMLKQLHEVAGAKSELMAKLLDYQKPRHDALVGKVSMRTIETEPNLKEGLTMSQGLFTAPPPNTSRKPVSTDAADVTPKPKR